MSAKIVNEVIDTLEAKKYDYTLINYPEHNRKSIDLIINSKGSTLVKMSEGKVTKDEISDLKKISIATHSPSLIVTNSEEEDIVSIKAENVFAISSYGFKKMLNGEKIFLYRTRGGIFIKIRHDLLRRKRENMGYSIGDLAKFLGVSRKAIYDYERGDADVSLEVADKLIDIFGEDIIGDIIQYSMTTDTEIEENEISETPSESLKSRLIHKLKNSGLKIISLKLTAVDLIVKADKDIYLVAIENKDYNKSMKKFHEAKKMSSYIGSNLIIVTRSSRSLKECESLGYKAFEESDIQSLIDEIKGNSRG
ncbi:MAG: helix-turn-helix domain-containing protein [Saccharolobus sp.]